MRFIVLILSLSLCVMACASNATALGDKTVASLNAGALLVETSQTTADLLYESHQKIVIERESQKRPLPTQQQVNEHLSLVRKRWEPIWPMFDTLRATHASVVAAIEQDVPVSEVVKQVAGVVKQHQAVAELLKELREWYAEEKK